MEENQFDILKKSYKARVEQLLRAREAAKGNDFLCDAIDELVEDTIASQRMFLATVAALTTVYSKLSKSAADRIRGLQHQIDTADSLVNPTLDPDLTRMLAKERTGYVRSLTALQLGYVAMRLTDAQLTQGLLSEMTTRYGTLILEPNNGTIETQRFYAVSWKTAELLVDKLTWLPGTITAILTTVKENLNNKSRERTNLAEASESTQYLNDYRNALHQWAGEMDALRKAFEAVSISDLDE